MTSRNSTNVRLIVLFLFFANALFAQSNLLSITEKFSDYWQLGIEEWRKSYAEHEKLGKKAVLCVFRRSRYAIPIDAGTAFRS